MKGLSTLFLGGALLAMPALAQVEITNGPEAVSVKIAGKPYGDFYIAGKVAGYDVTKPFFWPLLSPKGTYVTRMWPMKEVAEEKGEKNDHQHQRGMWFAHDSVNKIDFWNNEASYTEPPKRGVIKLMKPALVTSGKDKGTITAEFQWQDRSGAPIVNEHRVMTFYDQPDLRTIDVDITLTAVAKAVFGDSKDGTFGIRLRPILQEDKGNGHIVNADGLETEKQAWGKPSNWCDYSGTIDGEKLGIAVLDNPANPGHPVRWHVRAYGLFAANPFGLAVFTNDKSQDGSRTLDPGQTLRYRYRVIIHEGDAKSADIAGQWTKYSAIKTAAK